MAPEIKDPHFMAYSPNRNSTTAFLAISTSVDGFPPRQTQPLTEFHHLAELPLEIRWMIWSHVFPRRVIDIFAEKFKTWTDDELDFIPKPLNLEITPEPGKKFIWSESLLACIQQSFLQSTEKPDHIYLVDTPALSTPI